MSPRAAWQLEAMGFEDVYDLVEGKADWIARGLPTEGKGPHYPLVGEIARRDIVHECRIGSTVEESGAAVGASGDSYCVVLNDAGVLMGRLRMSQLSGEANLKVEDVMERGPTTVRPTEPAAKLLKRMQARDVPAILVTSTKGHFVGVALRSELEALVDGKESHRYAGQERRA